MNEGLVIPVKEPCGVGVPLFSSNIKARMPGSSALAYPLVKRRDVEREAISDSDIGRDSGLLFFKSQVARTVRPVTPVKIRKSRRVSGGMRFALPVRHRTIAAFPVWRFPEFPG